MNRFPGDRSVLLLDNCRIHKCEELREAIESKGLYLLCARERGSHEVIGCVLQFIPAYSPDFNLIEESFSAGEEVKMI